MRRASLSKVWRFLFPIALLLFAQAQASAANWTTNTVEVSGGSDLGYYSSIALDTQGRPHVAYSRQGGGGSIRYATLNGGAWTLENVNNGHRPSIAVDSQNEPRIAYRVDSFPPETRYARKTGFAWSFGFVDVSGAETWGPSLALVPNGDAGVAWRGGGGGLLNYARPTGPFTWTIESPTFFDNNMNNSLSLATDSQGNPRIAFTDGPDLEYAERLGGAWTSTVVTNKGKDCSLALDNLGNPHISFHDHDTGSLNYATRGGGVWTIQTVDANGLAGMATAITLEAAGSPCIVYRAGGELRFARRFGGVWTTELISLAVQGHPAIDVDAQGRHHVAFLSSGMVRYAVRGNPLTDVPAASTGSISLRVTPNPIGPGGAWVSFAVPAGAGRVHLDVVDVSGRRVRTLASGVSASNAVRWDGTDDGGGRVAPGTYLFSLRTATGAETQRVTLVR